MSWGILSVGGLTLKETYTISDSTNAQSGIRTINVQGIETSPPLSATQIESVAEDLASMLGKIVPVTFSQKSDRNGYYLIDDVNTSALKWVDEASSFNWSLAFTRIGPDNAVDVESRLANVVRANDFSLTGERWHAPAIGHYGYHTGATMPTPLTRTAEFGAQQVVYRGVPAGINPRWGCPVGNFQVGRARLISSSLDRIGTGIRVSGTGWEMNNGLIRIKPGGQSLLIAAYTGGAWHDKDWGVFYTSGSIISVFDQMTVLRNDNECVTIRLMESIMPAPGMVYLDLTMRRGSRIVEGYMQRSAAADELKVRLTTAEAYVNNSASGYLVASVADADGNKFVCGSARTFTPHANGGVTRLATATMDFFIGVEVSAAVAGDTAPDLRNQYIGASSESTVVIPR